MALSASLQFGNNQISLYSKTYDVVECKCHFKRHHNFYLPDANAICDKMELTVVAPGKEDLNLYEWYIDQTSQSGKLTFDLTVASNNGAQVTKEITFEDALCFSIAENYDINKQHRRLLTLEVIADQITVEDVKFNH